MRTLIELLMAAAALSLMALGLTALRALSTRVQRLSVWFEARDLERRREHPSRDERQAAELSADRHFRTSVANHVGGIRETLDAIGRGVLEHLDAAKQIHERRTIEIPPPRGIDASREMPTAKDARGAVAPETTPCPGASPVARERQSPSRTVAVDPPGSAGPVRE